MYSDRTGRCRFERWAGASERERRDGPYWCTPRHCATAARSELGANLLTGGDSRSAAVGDWDIETVGGRETPRLAGGL